MLNTLKLLIPALLPSWNFFDIITASPRVEFTLLRAENEVPHEWREFRPRPVHLSFLQMLGRMFWNAKWSESMFVVGCAERILQQPTQHSEDEILQRIIADLADDSPNIQSQEAMYLQFRLLLVERQGETLTKEVVFHSRIQLLPMRDVA